MANPFVHMFEVAVRAISQTKPGALMRRVDTSRHKSLRIYAGLAHDKSHNAITLLVK